MTETIYTGLFEDEVADVLRSAGPGAVVRSGFYSWHPSGMICEDGLYSSGAGYYTVFIAGRRAGYHDHVKYLQRRLAHKEFTVEVF